MAESTIHIYRWTGLAGAPAKAHIDAGSVGTTRLSTSDEPDPGTGYPVPIPSENYRYSYWCATRLFAENINTGCTVNNLKFYTNGSLLQGLWLMGNDATTYIQAAGTEGTTGIELNLTNYSTLSTAPVDVLDWVESSQKSIAGSLVGPQTDQDLGDFIVFQLRVGVEASPGLTDSPTFYWAYDEVT